MRRGSFFFFFNDTATTEIYTLSLHDALPISAEKLARSRTMRFDHPLEAIADQKWKSLLPPHKQIDRKSTRLNSSHLVISYAVFCLKKKKNRSYLPTYTRLV